MTESDEEVRRICKKCKNSGAYDRKGKIVACPNGCPMVSPLHKEAKREEV